MQGQQDAQYIVKNLKPKKVMIIDDQEVYSTGLTSAMIPVFKKAGIQVDHESVSQKVTDFSSLVAKVDPQTTVVVRGAPPQISLVASSAVVKFGTTVTLTGTVSNKKAGETVTLVQLPFGQTTKQVVATLQTTSGGTFSFTVTPQLTTTYQAQWPGKSESSVTVQVQPMIKLPFVSKTGFFHFYVTASTSFAGRTVFLQRYTLAKTWVNIRALTLGSKSGRSISVCFVRSLVPPTM